MVRFQMTDACLDYHSKMTDLDLNATEPSPFDLIRNDSSPIEQEEDSNSTPELHRQFSKEMSPCSTGHQESQGFQVDSHSNQVDLDSFQVQSKPKEKSLGKRKLIHKEKKATIFPGDTSDSESEFPKTKTPKAKKGKKREGYPTNNFLPPFKVPHLNFLRKELGTEFVESFKVFQEIMEKDGVSRKDYQALYNIPEFRPAFEKFFSENVLYRELLISRSNLKSRQVFVKFIHIFKRAFLSKDFDKIN